MAFIPAGHDDSTGAPTSVTIKAPTGPFQVTTALVTDVASNPLAMALTNRVSLSIRNIDTTDSVFIGKDLSVISVVAVGTNSGWELFPNSAEQNLDLDAGESFFLICATGKSALVQIFEIASTP